MSSIFAIVLPLILQTPTLNVIPSVEFSKVPYKCHGADQNGFPYFPFIRFDRPVTPRGVGPSLASSPSLHPRPHRPIPCETNSSINKCSRKKVTQINKHQYSGNTQ